MVYRISVIQLSMSLKSKETGIYVESFLDASELFCARKLR